MPTTTRMPGRRTAAPAKPGRNHPAAAPRPTLAETMQRLAAAEAALSRAKARHARSTAGLQRRLDAAEAALASVEAREQLHQQAAAHHATHQQMLEQVALGNAQQTAQLRQLLEQHLRHFAFPSGTSAAEHAACAALARRFAPMAAIGVGMRRIGAEGDGGYVMLDALEGTTAALSLGIGPDVSWDLAMAGLGAMVHQFDHTVPGPPIAHPNFRFHRRRIAAEPGQDGVTLAEVLAGLPAAGSAGRVLKIDIEHDEWPVLDAIEPAALGEFSQIVCEFHWFGRAAHPGWRGRAERVLDKLNAQFQVVHVHGNNFAPCVLLAGIPFPAVLEVSFASRARFRFGPTDAVFPTPLDRPNDPAAPDHWLGRFDFPVGAGEGVLPAES